MAAYAGKKGAVYISTSGTGVASSVLKLNKWTLDSTTDKFEVTSFLDVNKTFVQGLPDIKGTFSGFFDDTETKITTGASSSDGVKIYLYPDVTDLPLKYMCGPAWLDRSYSIDASGAVTLTGNFVAAGSWANSTI